MDSCSVCRWDSSPSDCGMPHAPTAPLPQCSSPRGPQRGRSVGCRPRIPASPPRSTRRAVASRCPRWPSPRCPAQASCFTVSGSTSRPVSGSPGPKCMPRGDERSQPPCRKALWMPCSRGAAATRQRSPVQIAQRPRPRVCYGPPRARVATARSGVDRLRAREPRATAFRRRPVVDGEADIHALSAFPRPRVNAAAASHWGCRGCLRAHARLDRRAVLYMEGDVLAHLPVTSYQLPVTS